MLQQPYTNTAPNEYQRPTPETIVFPEFIKTAPSRVTGLINQLRNLGVSVTAPTEIPPGDVALVAIESASQNQATIVVFPEIPSLWYFRPETNINARELIRTIISSRDVTITAEIKDMIRNGYANPQLRDIIRASTTRVVPRDIMGMGAEAIIAWLEGSTGAPNLDNVPIAFAGLDGTPALPPVGCVAPEPAAPPAAPPDVARVEADRDENSPTVTFNVDFRFSRSVSTRERTTYSDLEVEVPREVVNRGDEAIERWLREHYHNFMDLDWDDAETDHDASTYGNPSIDNCEFSEL